MKFFIDLYARPLTREQFAVNYIYLDFDVAQDWSESINIFLSDSFWEYFEKLSTKSVYKVSFILEITPRSYYDSYNGCYEYDEDVEIEKVLYLNRAKSFKELRTLVALLKETEEIG